MKIDRANPRHWLWLGLSALNVLCAVALRALGWRPEPSVLLYGHKLNGNLAAILEENGRRGAGGLPLVFLSMDPPYHRRLRAEGRDSACLASPACIPLLAGCTAIVSDHGLHALALLAKLRSVRCFDVWHGIPFKGFDAGDFAVQRRFEETWVASPRLQRLYVERFGFEPGQVAVTGYARTDRLVDRRESLDALRDRLQLQRTRGRKVVLFAPTWKQDAQGRSLIPFGIGEREFFRAIVEACRRHGALLLFRAHLNSLDAGIVGDEDLVAVPHAAFPDTEGVLLLSDVLVCDWSSIAFDFLLLDRPTLFLDVEPPFAKGFSLGPEYRFGAVVDSLAALLARLEQALARPEEYHREFAARHAAVRAELYGEFADGHAAARCLQRLEARGITGGSSR